MPDMFSKEKRSEIMSKIRSKGTNIELKLKETLEQQNIKFEYQPKMFGKPDFLIPPRIVVFCDSSFWHGREWNKLKHKLSKPYWYEHIKKNRKRDKIVTATLKEEGFAVLRFWDFQLMKETNNCLNQIKQYIQSTSGDNQNSH